MPVTKRACARKRPVWFPRTKALRMKRAETGVTVVQIAKDLGRSKQHVSDVLNGARTSERLAKELACYFSVPVEDLFIELDLESPDQASCA